MCVCVGVCVVVVVVVVVFHWHCSAQLSMFNMEKHCRNKIIIIIIIKRSLRQKRESNPRSVDLEVEALTTRPTWW